VNRSRIHLAGCSLVLTLIAALTLAMTACGSKPTISTIAISPSYPANLAIGSTVQFGAAATYSNRSTSDVTSRVTWASTDPSVATISASGLATGLKPGTTSISARLPGVARQTASLTVVTAPTISSIAIRSTLAVLALGSTELVTATATYSDYTTADVTSRVTWESSAPDVARISASGLATGVTTGTTYVKASVPGVTSPQLSLTVVNRGAVLSSIEIVPGSSADLTADSTLQLAARGIYSDGSFADITPHVKWASSNESVATVSDSGLVTAAEALGVANITASMSGITSRPVTLTGV
jgi:hypothetical protein